MGVVPHALAPRTAHDRRMAVVPLRISIEIDRDPESLRSLRGRVLETGSVQEFVGWLGLLGALGSAIDRLSAADGPDPPD